MIQGKAQWTGEITMVYLDLEDSDLMGFDGSVVD